jgi:UDP-GlcNAc:undecaprenyl-phosphate GlcNAc-1-phosphate transferase
MEVGLLINILGISLFSFLLTLYLIPLMIKAAKEMKILDMPDNKLKKHIKPTPYLGGLAIYMAIIFSTTIMIPFNRFTSAFFLGATMIVFLGFIDDLKALKPGIKFLFQIIVVFIIIKGGVYIKIVFFPQWFNYLLTFLWLLTIINAMNFLDIMNGLTSFISLIVLISFIFYTSLDNNFSLLLISTSTFGAVLAFFYHNFPDAHIFLGDTGSMLLGYTFGVLSFAIDYSNFTKAGIITPLIILFVPLFEIIWTISRRIYFKIPPWKGSPHHYAFYIRDIMGVKKTVYFLGSLSFLAGIISILNYLDLIEFEIVLSVILLLSAIVFPIYKTKHERK